MRANWRKTTIGEVCDVVNGGTPKTGVSANWGGPHMWITPAEMGRRADPYVAETERQLTDAGLAAANLLPPYSVILSSRAPIGHLVINKVPMATNQGCKGLVPKKDLHHKYLFYYLGSIVELLNDLGTGATFKELSGGKLKEVPIPLPPLAEQQRIVAILDEAFAGLAIATANAEKNLKNARELFEGCLDLAVEGRLLPQRPDDEPVADLVEKIDHLRLVKLGVKKFEKSKIGDDDGSVKLAFPLPENWKSRRLEELTFTIADGVHKTPRYVADGIPFVTVKNLTAGPGISFEEINYVTRADHQEFIKRTHPEQGDILITKDGTIGVVRVVETEVEFSIFVSVALIKPVMRELTRYLAYAVSASCVQRQIVPKGAALKHLYLVDLRKLVIPLPPLSEQARIVKELDSRRAQTERLEEIYREKLSSLVEIKQTILQKAFSGELTSPPSQAIKEAAE